MRLSLSFRLVAACLAVFILPTSGSAQWGGDYSAARPARTLAVPLGNLNRPQADVPALGPVLPTVVLTDTTDLPGANAADASAFDGFPTLSSQAADDFVVPGNAFWRIITATASGEYADAGGIGVDSLLVQFYGDSGGGLPGNLITSTTILGGSFGGLGTGVFVVPISPSLTLGPGHYWFSAQAHVPCPTFPCKRWLWTERTAQFLTASVWQNPAGGHGTSCSTWMPRVAVCHIPASSSGSDLLFKLEGSSTPVFAKLFLPVVRR
jgi:hypothetical protein